MGSTFDGLVLVQLDWNKCENIPSKIMSQILCSSKKHYIPFTVGAPRIYMKKWLKDTWNFGAVLFLWLEACNGNWDYAGNGGLTLEIRSSLVKKGKVGIHDNSNNLRDFKKIELSNTGNKS